jgi:hypothetical protein
VGFDNIIQSIAALIVTGLVARMWWDVRTIRKETTEKLDKIKDEMSACLLSVAKEYASRESLDRLWARVDKVEAAVAFLKGKFNGE